MPNFDGFEIVLKVFCQCMSLPGNLRAIIVRCNFKMTLNLIFIRFHRVLTLRLDIQFRWLENRIFEIDNAASNTFDI